jgi:hypothetical protein
VIAKVIIEEGPEVFKVRIPLMKTNRPMKILIIEDEQAAVRRLQKLLSEIDTGNEVIGALGTIESAVHWF